MKSFRLANGRIVDCIKANRLIFIIFLIGIILSDIIFIYFYGNVMPYKVAEAENALQLRTFTVESADGMEISTDKLNILDCYGVNEVWVSCYANIQGLNTYPVDVPNGEGVMLVALRNNNETKDVSAKVFFQEDELKKDMIILSKEYGAMDSIRVNGVNFQVARQIGNMATYPLFIPYDSFKKHNFLANQIQYYLTVCPSENQALEIEQILTQEYPQADIIIPDLSSNNGVTRESYLVISVQYVLSTLSFLILFKYMLEQNKSQDAVYAIVGATKGKIMYIIILEASILSVIGAIFAVVLHCGLYNLIFDNINIYKNIRYTLVDYLICCSFTVLLSAIASLPFILTYIRSSTADFKREMKI